MFGKDSKIKNRPNRNDFCMRPHNIIILRVCDHRPISRPSWWLHCMSQWHHRFRTLCEIHYTYLPGERGLRTTVSECEVSRCPTLRDSRCSTAAAAAHSTVLCSPRFAPVTVAARWCRCGGRRSHMPLIATFILEFKIFLNTISSR